MRSTLLASGGIMFFGPLIDLLLTYWFGYEQDRAYWLAHEGNRVVASCVARYGFWAGGLVGSLPLFALIPIFLIALAALLRDVPLRRAKIAMLGASVVLLAIKVAAGLTWLE